MMDRNLGAFNNTIGDTKGIGLMYQWGRKDPFPGPAGFNTSEPTNIYGSYNIGGTTGSWNGIYSVPALQVNTANATELYVVQYPTVFLFNNDSYISLGLYVNENLWGTPWNATGSVNNYNGNQGTKSIYDPCPIGYRVPPHDFANKAVSGTFTNGNALTGIVSSDSFWFPASGCRDRTSGGLITGNAVGYYWSSSPHASKASGHLAIYNGGVEIIYDSNGAYGYSVRCVSE